MDAGGGDGGPGSGSSETEPPLSGSVAEAREAFERHLSLERSLSRHTVRAYLGDVDSLLRTLAQAGGELDELDLGVLRRDRKSVV